MYALVDCNNFYASCERVFNPTLEGKAVAILSNNDGCVIAMSDEAKKTKLPFGAPIFKWQQFCEENNVTVLSSNYSLYGDMSSRVMKILEQFSPDIEVYSIDEAFLQLKGFEVYNIENYGAKIRSRVLQWTGIPTCVGIAPTKALTKLANKIARKFPEKTKGVYVIDSELKRIKALQWMPIENIWGIGSALAKKLKAKGCVKAYDFTQLDDVWVRKNLSITVWRLKKDLEGISKIGLETPVTKKAIATTRSFEYTFSDIDNIKERIATFAVNCAEKLRKQKSCCHMVMVLLQTDRFNKDTPQYNISKTVVFSYPTASTLTIAKAAVAAVKTIFKENVKYKRAGVIVTGLVPSDNYQINIFECENAKHKPLMQVIDKLNSSFKADKVKLASQDLKRTWKMRQERLSPKYTTNINDIISVK
ncbi:Y-family DNA polymerase [Tenacibaculum aestuariivivum]|uniref:Y-family DNA polymerase n=1 Tax=Tenacibaculum aestuariivivum TaxID=2006131 RepID=UPI003AB33315